MKYILILLLNVIILSCFNDSKLKTTYYDSGEIQLKESIIDDSTIECIHFYKSGIVSEKYKKNNNKIEGEVKYYFESGKIERIGLYKNDKAIGWHTFYSENGNIIAKREYLLVDSLSDRFNNKPSNKIISYLNQVIIFNKNGDTIIDKSLLYKLDFPDTLNYQDTLVYSIKLTAPAFKKGDSQIQTGNLNRYFALIDSSSYKAWASNRDNHLKVDAYEIANKKGKQTLRGKIINYEGEISYLQYFSFQFYVKW